ncbi:MAG TPA: iron-sulfur cluster biosynthesis family protein [Thermoplasmata archaeon]|nr:iron-sulfur cluster biosynthesis family protein [Thermoplasmata archaeon]
MALKIEVSNEAKDQVRRLIGAQKPGTAVRVFLQSGGGGGGGCGCGSGGGGGCCGGAESSGPSFGMAFDRPRNGDEVVKVDGFNVVADSTTSEVLDGAKIDFVQDLNESGFRIIPKDGVAPLAPTRSDEGGCGCGAGGCGCG